MPVELLLLYGGQLGKNTLKPSTAFYKTAKLGEILNITQCHRTEQTATQVKFCALTMTSMQYTMYYD